MGKFLFGFILGLIVIPMGVYYYFVSGDAPVGTAAQAMPFEKTLAKKALNARVEKEMPKSVPMAAEESTYTAGVQVYRENCAVCHGLPGQPENNWSRGMFPYPPQLFKGKGVSDDPAGETYWKVANGIRLTGMPAFKISLPDIQMWQVSLLLANSDKLSQTVKDKLATPLKLPQ